MPALLVRLHVPAGPQSEGGHDWLLVVNGLSAIVVLALVAWIEVTMPEFRQRMIAAYAIGAEALAIALLARGAVRSPLQYVSLVFGVLFAVAFAWAWLPPEMPAPWLHRIVAAIVALAATMVVYGFGLVKLLRRENEWTRAAQRLVPVLAVISALLLVGVLGIEVAAFALERPVPITWPALLAVAIALVGLAAAALVAALVPGRDPLGLVGARPHGVRLRGRGAARAHVPAHSRDDAVAVQRLVPAVLAAGGDGDRVCRRRARRVFSAAPAERALRAAARRPARCCRCCRRSDSGSHRARCTIRCCC